MASRAKRGMSARPDSISLAPGLWVREQRMHAQVNAEYLRLQARRMLRRVGMLRRLNAWSWLHVVIGAVAVLILLMRAKARPYVVTAAGSKRSTDAMSCTLRVHGKRHMLYFGVCARSATRIVFKVASSAARFNAEAAARKHFGEYFRLPAYTADPAQRTFAERFVEGHVLADATPERQIAAVERLTGSYARLTADSRPQRATSGRCTLRRITRCAAALKTTDPSADAALDLAGAILSRQTVQYPCLYAHNDLSGTNVIVASDGRPVLIDFERAAYGVFFGDLLWLIFDLAMRNQPACLTALLSGHLDAAMQQLWQAADQHFSHDKLRVYACMAICTKTANDISQLGGHCWTARTFAARMRLACGEPGTNEVRVAAHL
jgi:hypothetical protein